jgi:hypothetical protein
VSVAIDALGDLVHVLQPEVMACRPKVGSLQEPSSGELIVERQWVIDEYQSEHGGRIGLHAALLIPKPFTHDELVARVKAVFDAGPTGPHTVGRAHTATPTSSPHVE